MIWILLLLTTSRRNKEAVIGIEPRHKNARHEAALVTIKFASASISGTGGIWFWLMEAKMSRWEKIEISSVHRPVVLPSERDILVESNVGIYEGKYKAMGYQNGRTYLTSHRICYVDDVQPVANSIGLRLSLVRDVEYYGGFLRSSPKITLYLRKDDGTRASSPALPIGPLVSWVCPICFYSNDLPRSYEHGSTELPPCLTCGIKASHELITDAIAAPGSIPNTKTPEELITPIVDDDGGFRCPRCTFLNHPSLTICEMCGARLISPRLPPGLVRTDSPGPMTLLDPGKNTDVDVNVVKLSFRGNGDKAFYNALRKVLATKEWTRSNANSPRKAESPSLVGPGIHGLQQVSERNRQRRQEVLGSALEDLQGLMTRAQELVQLAEQYAHHLEKEEAKSASSQSLEARRTLRQSSQALGLSSNVVTKEMAHDQEVFHAEVARQLAEFFNTSGVLKREGGVITLFDLFAMYNRARGISLISPKDLYAACELFEKLQLPIRLRKFKSGLLVVQEAYRTPQVVIRQVVEWMSQLESWKAEIGVSAQDASTKFGWSLAVANEELEMAEEYGALCRDEQLSGMRFFENRFLHPLI
jgi:ESCRT-II complex subunit VPS36